MKAEFEAKKRNEEAVKQFQISLLQLLSQQQKDNACLSARAATESYDATAAVNFSILTETKVKLLT